MHEETIKKDKRTILKVTLSNGRKLAMVWNYKETGSKKHTLINVIEGHEVPEEIKPEDAIFTGKAHLHKGDVFSKNVGRVRSMGKALEALFPHVAPATPEGTPWVDLPDSIKAENKEIRMEVWEAYKKWRNGAIVNGSKINKLKRRIADLVRQIPQEVVKNEVFAI